MYLNQDFAILGRREGNGALLDIIKQYRAGLKQPISMSTKDIETKVNTLER